MPHLTHQKRYVALVLALLVAVATLAAPTTAQAATPAPVGLTPNAVAQAGIPTLQWNRVSGATQYTVQVATTASYDNVVWQVSTVNRRAVPAVNLPQTGDGKIYWRVKAHGPSGESAYNTASFTRTPVAGPTLVSPADDAQLVQPTDPALLSWTAVNGATGYTVEIDTASDFIGATTHNTQTTSLVVPNPDIATEYFWRVRANFGTGASSDYSSIRSYTLLGLEPADVVSPVDNENTKVEDVVLKWTTVPGAATYNLQVSTDINFPATAETHSRTQVTGTTYSPTGYFGNDQYYWRVSPVDTAGNTLDWDDVPVWHFQRAWADQPTLEYPIDNATVGNPFHYQWTAVEHASHYRLELSNTEDFDTLLATCLTRQTTYVPQNASSDCFPQSQQTLWWRVVAVDGGACTLSCTNEVRTDAIVAPRERFTYSPNLVTQLSPANGATVQIPTLRWASVAGASKYRITIATAGGTVVDTRDTAALAYTPRNALTVGTTYRWQVQTVSESNRLGPSILVGSQRTFTVAAYTGPTQAKPEPISATPSASTRFPVLKWAVVPGATNYKVLFRSQGAILWHYLDNTFAYSEGAFEGTTASGVPTLAPDTYEFMVEAHGNSGLIEDSDTIGTYTITSLDGVTDRRAALTGQALNNDANSCLVSLPAKCVDLRQTPVLRWGHVPDAGFYKVYVSRDEEMTNLVFQPVVVEQNQWMPKESLFDSQAGSAFFWHIQPCKANGGGCNALQHATNAFNKRSNEVELNTPVDDTDQPDIITFTWDDYLATNSDPSAGHRDSTNVAPRQEAMRYQIQVSEDPNFDTEFDNQIVEQTTYTAFDKTYKEGPVYWRVRAWDGSNNPLAWSAVGHFVRKSSSPVLQSPINGVVVGKTEPFRWSPMSYAKSYDIQIYRNNEIVGGTSDPDFVFQGNSKQVAFSLTNALPASAAPYTWRVRRIDSGGKEGPWSDLASPAAKFKVTGTAPVQVAPASGAKVIGNESMFTWQAAAGATAYRYERRDGGGNVVSIVQTPALAWAPTEQINDGTWQWRVSSLDTNSQVLGSSPWRTFTVDATRPTVISFKPADGSIVKPKVNFVATFSEPVTNVNGTTVRLFKKGAGVVAAKVTLSASKRTVTLNPTKNLARGKKYTLKISSGVKDLSGLQAVPKTWKVTVKK